MRFCSVASFRWCAVALLLVLTACGFAGRNSEVVPTALPGERFPTVVGVTLDGEEVPLPFGFHGQRNLVIVAFRREQQADAESWLALYDSMRSDYPSLEAYEVPTIDKSSAVFRLWVNTGMRFGIDDAELRDRVYTLYLDREIFQRALAIPDRERIQVFLLNGDGNVLWRSAGPASDAARRELAAALGG